MYIMLSIRARILVEVTIYRNFYQNTGPGAVELVSLKLTDWLRLDHVLIVKTVFWLKSFGGTRAWLDFTKVEIISQVSINQWA